ncbi:hypothetical protein, partial [Vibrio fluvialis]|uniref:hypothetical protein n=1 Tax=Vibrio fluvialis TaxID=676 RepID=UPI001EEA0F0B
TPLFPMRLDFLPHGAPIPGLPSGANLLCQLLPTHSHTPPHTPPAQESLGCYSLNAAQKAKGLANLQNVRHSLKERQLEPLRTKRQELVAKANHEDTRQLERARIAEEIQRIDRQAQRIQERWS